MIMLEEHEVDIAMISETWLTDATNNTTSVMKSYGDDIVHNFRDNQRGGGTAIVFKVHLNIAKVSLD